MAGDSLEWLPWYWKDWRLSDSYREFDPEARGIYRDLLDECFVSGGFKLDFPSLARLCGTDSCALERVWATISPKFTLGADGRYCNPEMAKIRATQGRKHTHRIERAKRGAQVRWAQGDNAHSIPPNNAPSKAYGMQRERKTERLSLERRRNGAGPADQPRRSPEPQCQHPDGYWGEYANRPKWFCRTCEP